MWCASRCGMTWWLFRGTAMHQGLKLMACWHHLLVIMRSEQDYKSVVKNQRSREFGITHCNIKLTIKLPEKHRGILDAEEEKVLCLARNPPPPAANPNAVGAATSSHNSGHVLFVPPRLNAQPGTTSPSPPPASKGRSGASKRPAAAAAAAAQKPVKKAAVAKTTGFRRPTRPPAPTVSASQQPPPPPAPSAGAPFSARNLLDQMTTSVDHETFMAQMNVGSSFSHSNLDDENGEEEEEFGVDEHGEGLIEPPRGRSVNYTMEEDRLLCQTWLQIGGSNTFNQC